MIEKSMDKKNRRIFNSW